MSEPILPIESIQERDVDLILLEELSTDDKFSEWFIQELNLPLFKSSNGAWRSITDFGLGETDILFSYNSNNKNIYVLIENKLDALFQDEQFKRYEKRAQNYINKGSCDIAFCVLIAPALYCENQNNFECFISYETIIERFEFSGTKRSLFKSNLLKIATEKLRRGYQPVNSVPVQSFWHSYWVFKESEHCNLRMKKPGIIPYQSDWPMLYDDDLRGIIFRHKFAQGNIDATFKEISEEKAKEIRSILPESIKFVKHKKTFSLRIFSGKIDRTKDFNSQIENIKKGLKNIEKLRDWIKKNKISD
ncbi:PD-(D/E)XK nuclease family protein [Lutibacter sp.]|uniref:PD-(D/E)XK nuclease family protein n=1 Tax=Lutibacter sp. TaxID=1925666 RepID=UPI003569DB79